MTPYSRQIAADIQLRAGRAGWSREQFRKAAQIRGKAFKGRKEINVEEIARAARLLETRPSELIRSAEPQRKPEGFVLTPFGGGDGRYLMISATPCRMVDNEPGVLLTMMGPDPADDGARAHFVARVNLTEAEHIATGLVHLIRHAN